MGSRGGVKQVAEGSNLGLDSRIAPLARSALVLLVLSLITRRVHAQEAAVDESEGYPSELLPPPEPEPSSIFVRQWQGLRTYLSFNVLTGTPFEEARANGGSWAWGFGMALGFSYDDWPVTFGLDIVGARFGVLPGQVDGDSVRLRNRVIMFDGFVRLQPARWKTRPYIEGVAGFKGVSEQYIVNALIADEDNSTESDFQSVSTLGVGAGLDLTLAEKGSTRAYLTLGVRWLHGGKVSYEKYIARGDETSSVAARFATTTTLFSLGVSVDIDMFAPDVSGN